MHSNYYTNSIKITPSARKGIHNNCQICLLKELRGMGKYGLNDKKNYSQNTSHEGVDEVDNAKGIHGSPSSPKAILNKGRKNSINRYNQMDSYESDEENTSEEYDSLDATADITLERIRNNNSTTQYPQTNRSSPNGSQWKLCLIVSVVAIILAYICNCDIFRNIFFNNNNMINIYDERKFFKDLIHLGEKYRVTDDSILQIRSGISAVFRREDTGCFIFTYNSGNDKFNNAQFDNFMNDVSFAAARYLRNESRIRGHATVESSELDMRVHSELIERYQDVVTRTGVMFIKDIDEVPARLAMAFHYYCDEYNPLIKRSAIFFTLDMARCSDQKASHQNIEKCLNNKWAAVSKINMLPLLARVVNIVVDVTNVF